MLNKTLTGHLDGFFPGPRASQELPPVEYKQFELEAVSPRIGSIVKGIALADPVDDELKDALTAALVDRKVLFFQNQDLSSEQHRQFAANWGSLESHPFFREVTGDQEDVDVVRLQKDEMTVGLENVWHTDVSWRSSPSMGAVLRAVEVPETGGDTLWCDMEAAYEYLPDALKEKLEGMTAIHDWVKSFGITMPDEKIVELQPHFPPSEHPVVRTHPDSGNKILYVNRIFTDKIVGLEDDEAADLLNFLTLQATFPEYQCRWNWKAGDVAFWDNRSTQHYATSDYFPQNRVMERISIIGDQPF